MTLDLNAIHQDPCFSEYFELVNLQVIFLQILLPSKSTRYP